jgi:hypothetical protein
MPLIHVVLVPVRFIGRVLVRLIVTFLIFAACFSAAARLFGLPGLSDMDLLEYLTGISQLARVLS